jgi:hypothetical protein
MDFDPPLRSASLAPGRNRSQTRALCARRRHRHSARLRDEAPASSRLPKRKRDGEGRRGTARVGRVKARRNLVNALRRRRARESRRS